MLGISWKIFYGIGRSVGQANGWGAKKICRCFVWHGGLGKGGDSGEGQRSWGGGVWSALLGLLKKAGMERMVYI